MRGSQGSLGFVKFSRKFFGFSSVLWCSNCRMDFVEFCRGSLGFTGFCRVSKCLDVPGGKIV